MSKIIKKKYCGDSTNTPIAETIEETIPDNSDDRIFELEKQLHEQYAVNNNSNVGTLVSLIGALLISFTGYGYVLYQYSIGECAIGVVSLAAIAVMLVMVLLYCISVNLGAGQRMEQFITIAIRKKHYGGYKKYNEIFPSGYHPFKKDYCSFVQGVYNVWTKVALLAVIGVEICGLAINWNINAKCSIFITPTIQAIYSVFVCILYRLYKFTEYQEREEEYLKQKQNEAISYLDFIPDLKDNKDNKFIKQIKNWLIKYRKWLLAVIAILLLLLVCSFFCSVKELHQRQENTLNIKIENSDPIKVQIID